MTRWPVPRRAADTEEVTREISYDDSLGLGACNRGDSICWVSAWLVHTDDGSVLIDTLCGPFAPMLLENIAKTGTDLVDIKYVLMIHGHFDHVGGAAALKPHMPNATFVMTQGGWDEAVESAAASQGGRRAWEMIEPEIVVADGDTSRWVKTPLL